ncbi:MAG: hypothetical protein AAF065_06425 [Verrucomicrobiota bacterium]
MKNAVFSGSVSVDGTTVLSFDNTVPDLSGAHYVQVTSGALSGTIMDIVSSDSSTVTLETVLPIASGDIVLVRPHFLIEDLGTEFTSGSSVTLYNSDGTQAVSTYLNNFLGMGWDGEHTSPIYPGEGFVLISTGPFEIIYSGAVSVDPVLYYGSGGLVNIIGALSPNDVDATVLFDDLPGSSTISVYSNGSGLLNPTVYTKAPDFLGGAWNPDISLIDFGGDAAVVVIPSQDTPIPIPPTIVLE